MDTSALQCEHFRIVVGNFTMESTYPTQTDNEVLNTLNLHQHIIIKQQALKDKEKYVLMEKQINIFCAKLSVFPISMLQEKYKKGIYNPDPSVLLERKH